MLSKKKNLVIRYSPLSCSKLYIFLCSVENKDIWKNVRNWDFWGIFDYHIIHFVNLRIHISYYQRPFCIKNKGVNFTFKKHLKKVRCNPSHQRAQFSKVKYSQKPAVGYRHLSSRKLIFIILLLWLLHSDNNWQELKSLSLSLSETLNSDNPRSARR